MAGYVSTGCVTDVGLFVLFVVAAGIVMLARRAGKRPVDDPWSPESIQRSIGEDRREMDEFTRALKYSNELGRRRREAIKAKAWADVVRLCDEAIAFSGANPGQGNLNWLADKDAAKALFAQGLVREAIQRIDRAIAGAHHYRATHALNKPDDFLSGIGVMEKLRERWRKAAGG